MKYALNDPSAQTGKSASLFATLRSLLNLIRHEWGIMAVAFLAIFVNIGATLAGFALVGFAIDAYVVPRQYSGVLWASAVLLGLFLLGLVASYAQTRLMGGVGQRLLFTLRSAIFSRLQALPVAFFNQNKAGDLISRINNDTDKLNQFFSQALMQFLSNLFVIGGSAIFILALNPRLGVATLSPALVIILITRLLSPWVKKMNALSLRASGDMSAEIQESLNNFKVVVAFNRRDYFRTRFAEENQRNYKSAVKAGIANNIFVPIYGLCSALAQFIVIAYGIYLIVQGQFTVGLLISYFAYVTRFYEPLKQLATLWASFQTALAAWDRISAILDMESDMTVLPPSDVKSNGALLEFENVHFGYPDGNEVLHGISFALERGKTYALVGPTGGGKTTTASLMARLYDPTEGTVRLEGRDIRSVEHAERVKKIGFILQEPFLLTGTVRENILYGNEELAHYTAEQLSQALKDANLETLLSRFEQGLETKVISGGEAISLGQRQLIAFIRAVLRKPDLLILDEATANIDTVTEQLLEDILRKLPKTTTKVIIAHRLNTIENADEIFFVNAGDIVKAGSMEHAVEMLLHGKRTS